MCRSGTWGAACTGVWTSMSGTVPPVASAALQAGFQGTSDLYVPVVGGGRLVLQTNPAQALEGLRNRPWQAAVRCLLTT